MNYRFLEPAKSELVEAIDFYNRQKNNLGSEFFREVERGIKQILRNPRAWQELSKNTRRCIVKRFPFGLIYQIREKEILIVAVMHLKRKPGSWKGRI